MTIPTLPVSMPTPTVEQRLPLTPEQVALLNEAEAATQAAIGRMNLLLASIMAAHRIRNGTFKRLEPGDPAHLVVTVPGPASPVSPHEADGKDGPWP